MKFALVNNGRVELGPIFWNFNMFQSVITDELNIDFKIPKDNQGFLEVNESVKIYPVVDEQIPNHNSKIEQLQGPIWSFDDVNQTAAITYNVVPREVLAVQNELKAIIADNRWKKEVGGIKVTIQNQELDVLTDRNERNIYLQALQLGQANKNWKFNNIWITLDLADLQTIVTAILTHIQMAFDWEASKVEQIDSTTDLNLLDQIELTFPEA